MSTSISLPPPKNPSLLVEFCLLLSRAFFAFHKQCQYQGSVIGDFQTVVRVLLGNKIPLPNYTSLKPTLTLFRESANRALVIML